MNLVKVVDENSNDIGAVRREHIVKLGLRHQVARIIICSKDKKHILLQQRSLDKDSCPGMWDTSASGHVDQSESPEKATLRELKEELGITIYRKSLMPLFTSYDKEVVSGGILSRESYCFYVIRDPNKLQFTIDKTELNDARWVNIGELKTHAVQLTSGASKTIAELQKKKII